MSDTTRPLPFWVRNLAGKSDLDCNVGTQPDVVPRIPARIIPHGGVSTLSAATVSEVICCTQKIVTYSAYEVVRGPMADYSDLRSVDGAIAEFAKLRIEPFEEGSFVIPAVLSEESISIRGADGERREFAGHQIVERFVSLIENAANPESRDTSLGAIHAIEELGRILRREAERIEYYPVGMRGTHGVPKQLSVTDDYVARVSHNRKRRQDPSTVSDTLEGVLTALDTTQGTLKIRVESNIVKGSFSPFMTEHLIQSLEQRVRISGVVEYQGTIPQFIRGFFSEPATE